MVRVVIAATLVSLAAARAAADPDPARADTLAHQADALIAEGDFIAAAARLRAAYDADPRPVFLCNTGVAFYKARDLPRAHLYLGRCLTAGGGTLEAWFLDQVRATFAAIEGELRAGTFAPIDVAVDPPGATWTVSSFGVGDRLIGAQLVWLPFGPHALHVEADGRVARDVPIAVTSRDHQAVRVALDRTPVTPPPPSVTPPPPPHRSRTAAWIATGAAGGLGLAAGFLYLRARSSADAAGNFGISDATYDDRVGAARRDQHLAWGLAGAAGAAAIAGGYLWYRALRTTEVTVAPTDGGAMASASGRF